MTAKRTILGMVFALAYLFGVQTGLMAQLPSVRIGIVVDGPSARQDQIIEVYRREIAAVLDNEYDAEFVIRTGDWTAARVHDLITGLLEEDRIDIVIGLGLVASQDLASRDSFPRPSFAPNIIDPVLQNLPFESREVATPRPNETETFRVSGVKNLHYVLVGAETVQEIQDFYEIFPFSKLTFLVMDAMSRAVPELEKSIKERVAVLPHESTEVVIVSDSAADAVARISPETDAVYVTPLVQLTDDEFRRLVEGINQRGLLSLSWERSGVEAGLLASLHPTEDPVRRSRRIAINIQEALRGGDPGQMSIEFDQATRLILNMATARQIGVSPRFTTLLEAELLNDVGLQQARTLSLPAVVREASAVNLDLAAADRRVSAGQASVDEARAPLLPQVGISGDASVVDEDRARVLPTLSETRYSASLGASQLIYSDRAWANYSIEKSFQDQRIEERVQLRLDVIEEAARAYLDLLRAKTVERVQKENLNLTRSNADVASSRVEIGVAGRQELFRWQSQLATNQRDVVAAEAARNQARIAVNRILNRPMDEGFGTVEATLNDPEISAGFEALRAYVDNPRGFQAFADFMTREALQAAPELKQLDAAIRASQRELETARRSFFIPDLSLDGGISAFKNTGVGSEMPPGLNNTDWFVGLTATLPLFSGGGRFAAVNRASLQVAELNIQREASSQRVEQRVRSILETANSSFIAIDLSRAQAEAARGNLELVRDSYAAGTVGILAVLDAQNEALTAELGAANAVFQYLSDLMAVQRSVGRFDYFRSPQERQEFLSRLDQFYREEGIDVQHP